MISSLLILLSSKLHSIYYNSLLIADHQYPTQGIKISFPLHDILIPAVIQLVLFPLCDWKTNLIIPPEDTIKIIEHTINIISIKHRLP